MKIETYADLLKALQSLPADKLAQRVQILPNNPDCDRPTGLLPVYAFDSLATFEAENTRDSKDGKNRLSSLVLMADNHPFGESGEICHDLLTGKKTYCKGYGEHADD